MATPQIPALFISHSGEQKGFTWGLYRELLHVHHNPFFDQDTRLHSLPKGSPFPSRIVEACRACKLGIVVVSHDYIESLWPMLELQQLLFHNPLSPHNVFPVFYKLKPADLSKQENLMRWRSTWERQEASWHAKVQDLQVAASGTSTSHLEPTLDISLWAKALEMLRYQSGQVLPDNKDEHAFIQAIVSNICKRLPPPDSFLMGEHYKGAEHIQQKIHELFQQQQRDEEIDDPRRMPISVGVYGVGGSGKTTVCRYMLSFYKEEYPGSCCFLQFPSREEDESQLLVQSMKDILSERGNLAKETLNVIKSVEQAMPHLKELLRRYRVFLILDNIWDWALQIAKQIVRMDYMPGSRLLVTARSEGLLQKLSSNLRNQVHVEYEAVGRMPAMQIVHVPSISEEEAMEALMAYSLLTSWQYVNNGEDLRGLARSCFFGEQCHPLLLKAVGTKLRHRSGHICSAEGWTQLISDLQAHEIHGDEEIEGMIVNVLETSYHALHSKLQETFLKLGTCVPKVSYKYIMHHFKSLSEWLSMVSDSGSHTIEEIRYQLIELEYHGLIQIYGEDAVYIHDLQMMLIENIVRENNGAPRCFFFEGDVATLSESGWRRFRYIFGIIKEDFNLRVSSPQRRWLKHINGSFPFDDRATSPNIEVLYLKAEYTSHARSRSLSVKHMQSLRYLELDCIRNLKEVGGWHGAPNLVSVKLTRCYELRKIESMTCLRRLESLAITQCSALKRLIIAGNDHVGHLLNLQDQDLLGCSNLLQFASSRRRSASLQRCILSINPINLRVLDLSECDLLESMEGSVCHGLTALEELSLERCWNLESIPDLKQLVKLRRLELEGCYALKEVKVGDAALTSLEHLSLDYGGCNLSMLSCSPLPISAFTNLRSLRAKGHKWVEIDVGSSNLPVSLENLHLSFFETAKEITGLRALVNLQELWLFGWPSLTKITGLGPLTKLVSLGIVHCASLREVGHWEAPFISNLNYVHILDCPKLETLSTMRHLTSLTRFYISRCPNVQREMLPKGAIGLINKWSDITW